MTTTPAEIWLTDSEGQRRQDFALGDSVFVTGRGLEPEFAKLVTVMDQASDDLRKRVEPELKRVVDAGAGGKR